MKNPIIVALDVAPVRALGLVQLLNGVVGGYEIGSMLFTASGPEIIRQIRKFCPHSLIFLNIKLFDASDVVARTVAEAVKLGVDMMTVHTSGGLEMLQAAEKSAQETASKMGLAQAPIVVGVTVLTSFDGEGLARVGVGYTLAKQVERLAALAMEAKLRGLVCSPVEVASLRNSVGRDVQLITPGIRTGEEKKGDQKRTLSARQTMDAGADWLVIGRPIYESADPLAAAKAIIATLS